MGFSSDAYIGWAIPLEDFDEEEFEETHGFDLDQAIERGCGVTEEAPDYDDKEARKEWAARAKEVVTVGYGSWGDCNGENGLLLTVGEIQSVNYGYEDLDPSVLTPPSEEDKQKFANVLLELGYLAQEPKLMLWTSYG